ncbi:MAG TPA: YegS/Rv2252/BmrU family lipid kinase [Chitinophagales bacterium]|nr:YegS/Rv2252/BmrU family lipid kinase [Chitinophagales bacterium]
MKLAFLLNGSARGLHKLQKNIDVYFKEFEPKFFISEYVGHIMELAKNAISRNYDTLIICGGDGTLNEAINGIIEAHKIGIGNTPDAYDWEKIVKIKVGVFPSGSGNDFAKTVKISKEITDLKILISQDKSQLIDIGWVSYFKNKQEAAHRFFINITDVGMGGETVLKLQNKIPLVGPDINYFWAITSTLATYEKVKIKAFNDDFTWEGKAINFVVANGKYFGNGLCVAPDASITDGKFEIVIIGDVNLMDYFKNLSKVKKGEKIEHPEVHYFSLDKVSIESLETRDISIDMDGEFIGYAPMTLLNLSKKINFIC